MGAGDKKSAEPRRTDHREKGPGPGGPSLRVCESRGVGSEGVMDNAASISVAVSSYQADLRSKVLGKGALAY